MSRMEYKMKCLIVGGGIAGLCTAKSLRDIGCDVNLVEINSAWTVYGVGIIQQSNVVRAMAQLDLLEEYLGVSAPFEEVRLFEPDGQLKATIPQPRLAGPEYPASLGVSRLALHEVLLAAAKSRGTIIRMGVTVTALNDQTETLSVTFSDGTMGSYDLLIGCDGAHSHVRTLMLGTELKPRLTGQSVWRCAFPRPKDSNYVGIYYGPRGNAGIVPMSQNQSYLFVTTKEAPNTRFRHEELAEKMRERLSDFGGLVAEIRETITDNDGVVYRPLETIFCEEWNRGRVLLIGDAVHTMTPHLGQGAGMAIEDAVVLGQELSKPRPFPEQIAGFLARRVERCRKVTNLSVQTGDWEIENSHHAERFAMVHEVLGVTAQPI